MVLKAIPGGWKHSSRASRLLLYCRLAGLATFIGRRDVIADPPRPFPTPSDLPCLDLDPRMTRNPIPIGNKRPTLDPQS